MGADDEKVFVNWAVQGWVAAARKGEALPDDLPDWLRVQVERELGK